jgi:hypothetical protein
MLECFFTRYDYSIFESVFYVPPSTEPSMPASQVKKFLVNN